MVKGLFLRLIDHATTESWILLLQLRETYVDWSTVDDSVQSIMVS